MKIEVNDTELETIIDALERRYRDMYDEARKLDAAIKLSTEATLTGEVVGVDRICRALKDGGMKIEALADRLGNLE